MERWGRFAGGIVGCREETGGRRALAGMIVGRERGIVELGGRESSTGIPHEMGTRIWGKSWYGRKSGTGRF